MQGLAHNLSIRWMDGQGGVAEGGTENAGDGDSDCHLRCCGGDTEPHCGCFRCTFVLLNQSVTKCRGLNVSWLILGNLQFRLA